MKNLNELTIKEARELLDAKKISATDLVKDCFEQIKKLDKDIRACLALNEAGALASAKLADKLLSQGESKPLLGIPFLAKDNFLTKGIITTAASKILENYVAPYNATAIIRLENAGAILLGKTNMDEFAHGASTENSAFKITRNPWDLSRVPGGSSGGSAVGVASNMCLFALGSDTGGSVRYPAGFCGVVGLKPTYGRISRHGLMAMTSSTDVVGVLAKSANDAALVLSVLAGPDDFDASAVLSAPDDYLKNINQDFKGLKVGLPKEYFGEGLNPEVKERIMKVANDLKEMGAEIIEVNLPSTKYCVPVYYIITPAEISSNLARFDGLRFGLFDKSAKNLSEIYLKNRGEGFGIETKRRIMVGTYVLSAGYFDAYYKKAEKTREKIKAEFEEVLNKVDILLTSTAPHTAFKIGAISQDPLRMYLEDVYMSGASLAGLPALSLPVGLINNLPVGAQLIGPRLGEAKILQVATALEKAYPRLIPSL